MIFIGIDPGKTGGLVSITETKLILRAIRFGKLANQKELARVLLKYLSPLKLYYRDIPSIYLENVWGRGTDGANRAFKFGDNYGTIKTCLYHVDFDFKLVVPTKWQRHLGCLSGGDKKIPQIKAKEIFPEKTITQDIADAYCIAEYNRRVVLKLI